MAYDYIRKIYGTDVRIGARVWHTETRRHGTVSRMHPSREHYVQVRFDGDKRPLPCHPKSLVFLAKSAEAPKADALTPTPSPPS